MVDQVLLALCSSAFIKYMVLYFGYRKRPKNAKLVGKVSAIWYYPVKSLRGVLLQEAMCTHEGLKPVDGTVVDRHFLVCNPENGAFISQRSDPKMALVSVEVDHETNTLICKAPGCEELKVPLEGHQKWQILRCRVWNDYQEGAHCGQEAEKWFTNYLGRPACLTFAAPGLEKRNLLEINTSKWHGLTQPHDKVAFANFAAYLLTTEASLADLNSRLSRKVPMENFRPNIVLDGSNAFDEDDWDGLYIGDLRFRHHMPRARCIVTTVDREKGVKDPDQEPLKTLMQFRIKPSLIENKALFGINLFADICGRISVGQPVYVTLKS